jgi:GNAT superfamily N-acetyltransferase
MFVEPLGKLHDRGSFDCGVPQLNEFLKKLARQQQEKNIGKTFVAVSNQGDPKILGFYTLSAGSIQFVSLPTQVQKKLPRYPVPVAILGRLAVNKSNQGAGVGKALLRDALLRVASVAESDMGVAAVVVDAKNEAAARYYEHYGFQPLRDKPGTLFLLTKTILEVFG